MAVGVLEAGQVLLVDFPAAVAEASGAVTVGDLGFRIEVRRRKGFELWKTRVRN